MTFNPSIPQPGDKISQSQPQLLINFSQLNNLFAIDHVEYTNSNVGNRGQHKQVTFYNVLGSDPNQVSPIATLYTKGNPPELFFQNGNLPSNVIQLTGPDSPTAQELRSGFIMISNPGGTAITFATPFPTSCAGVVVTGFNTGFFPSVLNGSVTVNGFTARTSGSPINAFYIAIGS